MNDATRGEPWRRYKPSTLPEDSIWYGTRGNRTADIIIVGESWGSEERRMKMPFMGKSGQILEILLREAGISIDSCLFANVVSLQPRGNNMATLFHPTKQAGAMQAVRGLYPKQEVLEGLARLTQLIRRVKPTLIIGLGNYTLWALTDNDFDVKSEEGRYVPTGIGNYRGSQLRSTVCDTPFLPTYHPAATFRTYAWRGMIRHDFRFKVPLAFNDSWEAPDRVFLIRPSYDDVINQLSALYKDANHYYARTEPPLEIAVDIETRGNFIACIGLAYTTEDAICIPILTTDKGKKDGYWTLDEEVEITRMLYELLTHTHVRVIGQNIAFDIQYIFAQMFFLPKTDEDTMLKHHCCFPGGGDPVKGTGPQGLVQKSLNHLSSLYCNHHKYWKDEGNTWETWMPEEQLWSYNCLDCCITYEVNERLTEVVSELNLTEQYKFQMDQLNELAIPMMLRGVKIDLKTRSSMTTELLDAIAELERVIAPMVPADMLPPPKKGQAPWYRSPKQLATLFYDELGIKPVMSDKGTPTTGKKALPILAKREPIIKPIINAIETLRSLNVFYGTFLSAALDPDNRMRCSFNVAGTETFRWSSSTNVFDRGTNLQNIPEGKREVQGVTFPNIRKIFVPDNNHLIIDADLAGADAQVVAWETGEEDLKDVLKKGIKIHSVVSNKLYGTDEQPYYDMCKRRIHATNYGGGYRTLHQTLGGLYGAEYTSERIEQDFQDWWFRSYPGVKRWHDKVSRSLQTTHGVENRFGNRIVYQDRIDSMFTKALAWIPQSTVALVTVKGALAIKRQFSFIEILMQVHDSVIFQIPKRERRHLDEIKSVLNSITVPYDDPLRIPWSFDISDKSWGACKE